MKSQTWPTCQNFSENVDALWGLRFFGCRATCLITDIEVNLNTSRDSGTPRKTWSQPWLGHSDRMYCRDALKHIVQHLCNIIEYILTFFLLSFTENYCWSEVCSAFVCTCVEVHPSLLRLSSLPFRSNAIGSSCSYYTIWSSIAGASLESHMFKIKLAGLSSNVVQLHVVNYSLFVWPCLSFMSLSRHVLCVAPLGRKTSQDEHHVAKKQSRCTFGNTCRSTSTAPMIERTLAPVQDDTRGITKGIGDVETNKTTAAKRQKKENNKNCKTTDNISHTR